MKPIQLLCMLLLLMTGWPLAHSQTVTIKAIGTGNTTGHIGNLIISNPGSSTITINPQTVYIPSNGEFQPYVATIPETDVLANTTNTIQFKGYCADVQSPAVPNGYEMPSVNTWIPVGIPSMVSEGHINVAPMSALPEFNADQISVVTSSEGYKTTPHSSYYTAYWPGTTTAVGGIINPVNFPTDFAPVIVDALQRIETAADAVLGDLDTPYDAMPEKETEAVIQHTFWIYMAAMRGDDYNKEHFSKKIYDQTGMNENALNENQHSILKNGIDQFWSAFTQVGRNAQVLQIN